MNKIDNDTYTNMHKIEFSSGGPTPETFEQVWARYEAAGYVYGRDALELVKLGFEIARGKQPQ